MKDGAQGRNRTTDTRIFSPLLYQLSYLAIMRGHVLDPSGNGPSSLNLPAPPGPGAVPRTGDAFACPFRRCHLFADLGQQVVLEPHPLDQTQLLLQPVCVVHLRILEQLIKDLPRLVVPLLLAEIDRIL